MDDVAVYGYITASKMKIILVLSLSDTVVKDVEVVNVSATNTLLSNIHDSLCSLIVFRVLISNPLRQVNESIPYGIQNCSRKPLPQVTRPSGRGQRPRELAPSRRGEMEELSTRCR